MNSGNVPSKSGLETYETEINITPEQAEKKLVTISDISQEGRYPLRDRKPVQKLNI